MGHAEFLATQAAKRASMTKRRKKIRKQASLNKAAGHIDFVICSFITIFCFFANIGLGIVVFILLGLPSLIDETRGTLTRPPWTTVKGEPDCPICQGKYFLSNGILTYWLGWKECSCRPTRHFPKLQDGNKLAGD